MIPGFGSLESVGGPSLDALEKVHHEYCPMSHNDQISTLCCCDELDKADKDAAYEDDGDDRRKYNEDRYDR